MEQLNPKAKWLFFSFYNRYIIWFSCLFIIPFVMVARNEKKALSEVYPSIKFYADNWYIFALLLILIIILLTYIIAYIKWKNYRYELGEDGYHQESGVIVKHDLFIPYERIQSVDIIHGPTARLLKLSIIIIRTASSFHEEKRKKVVEGNIYGIPSNKASHIRKEIISNMHKSKH